jgi:hypothetical protein
VLSRSLRPSRESAFTDLKERTMAVDMKLEVVVIPVSDVDRAKEFYAKLGWRLGDIMA